MPVCVVRWQPGPDAPRVPGVRATDHPRGARRQDGAPAVQTAAEAVDLRPAAKGRVLPGAPRLRQALLSRRTDEGVREHEPDDPQHRGRRDQLCRYRLHARPADEHAHGDRYTHRYAGPSDSDPHPAACIVGGDSSAGDRPCVRGVPRRVRRVERAGVVHQQLCQPGRRHQHAVDDHASSRAGRPGYELAHPEARRHTIGVRCAVCRRVMWQPDAARAIAAAARNPRCDPHVDRQRRRERLSVNARRDERKKRCRRYPTPHWL